MVAAVLTNYSSSPTKDEFYALFKQNCSGIFKDPPEEGGFFSFRNGTLTLRSSSGFALPDSIMSPQIGGYLLERIVAWIWMTWGQVAVAWALLVATTTTMSHYSRPSHRDPIQMPSQKLSDAFGEQFSYKVLRGVIRVCLTETLIRTLIFVTEYFIATVRSVVMNKSIAFSAVMETISKQNRLWNLADPLPFLFLLSSVAAALEPGMWGFKALWRGIQVARGNRLKSYFVYLVLFLVVWLDSYLSSLVPVKSDKVVDRNTLVWMLQRPIILWCFTMMSSLPRFFLLPVLYFLCKAWREKLTTMA